MAWSFYLLNELAQGSVWPSGWLGIATIVLVHSVRAAVVMEWVAVDCYPAPEILGHFVERPLHSKS
jgi:hypothetical protein